MQRQRRHRRRVSAGLYEERGCVSRCTCDCLVDDGCSRRSKATTMTMLSRGFRPVRAHFFPNNSEVTVPIPNTVRQLPSWLHVAGHAFCRRRCCDVPALRNAGVLFGRSTADVGHLHRSGNYADGWISLFLQRLARRPPRNVTWITVKRQTSILALHSTDAPPSICRFMCRACRTRPYVTNARPSSVQARASKTSSSINDTRPL